jgi:hypothetical protein
MPASVVIKHFTDGSITLKDGTGTPVTLVVPFSLGDLSISGMETDTLGRAVNAYETRGVLNSLRRGARVYPTVSFSCQLADVTDATNTTLLDFVLKRASFAGNTSTTAATGDVYTMDVVFTIEGTSFGDAADHVITMEDVHFTIDAAEGEPNTVSLSGTIYGTLVLTT